MVSNDGICDKQDIVRAKIIHDIGVVIITDKDGFIHSISDNHLSFAWVKKKVSLDDIGILKYNDVFHEEIVSQIEKGLLFCENNAPPKYRTYVCDIFYKKRTYVTIFAQMDGTIVVEIEDFDREVLDTTNIIDIANIAGEATSRLTDESSVNTLCRSIFETSGYDRGMTYKFLGDMSGDVVYEIKNDKVSSSFMGLRFPASDIPLPARKAYIDNPVRFISSSKKASSRLIQKDNSLSMTMSFLRGCTKPHKEYLKNMHIKSSMSISIIAADGSLWGIIALHSYTSELIPSIGERVSYTMMSSIVSNHVKNLYMKHKLVSEIEVKDIISNINLKESIGTFLIKNRIRLLDIFKADSISIFEPGGASTAVGNHAIDMKDLPIGLEKLIHGTLKNPIRSFVSINISDYKFVFTKRCTYDPIAWAGNPNGKDFANVDQGIVLPRKSFDKYIEHVSKTPPPFLSDDIERISHFTDEFVSIINRIKMIRIDENIKNERLKNNISEMKSDENYAFFANMSHELRTPLHAITGVLDIINDIEDIEDKNEMVKKYSDIGIKTCSDMMRTLDDILNVVKKTHEKKQIEFTLVVLKDLFDSTYRGLGFFATRNDIKLEMVMGDHSDEIVRVDIQKITQIYNNVVGNAIKFSGKNSTVMVGVDILDSQTDVINKWDDLCVKYDANYLAVGDRENIQTKNSMCKWLVLTSTDSGCGVGRDAMSKIFNMFEQGENIVTKKFSSTGLGLHISLQNAIQMNALFGIASTPGVGSVFFCAIPIEVSSMGNTARNMTVRDTIHGDVVNNEVLFVVVDDSKINLMISERQIKRVFVNAIVHTALNGSLGHKLVSKLIEDGIHIDGIFMDYHMPVMSGLESCRIIRRDHGNIPISMLTADVTENSRTLLMTVGVDFILIKPTRPTEIIDICVKMVNLVNRNH